MEPQKDGPPTSGEQSRTTQLRTSYLHRAWRVVRIPVYIIAVLYVGLVIYRIPAVIEQNKTKEVVDKIHAQKLTLKDVMGESLPPEPDPALVDATVAGVDANSNGIRDDVELEIFKLHPDSVPPERSGSSTRIRAAELQYAMELQNELTQNVFNSQTLVATLWEEGRGYFCIDKVMPNATDATFNSTIKEIKNLVLNTEPRKSKSEEILAKYMTSHTNPSDQFCDIELSSLPN